MQKYKSLVAFFTSLCVLIFSVIFFYPKVQPFYSLKNITHKDTIFSKASFIIDDFDISTEAGVESVELRSRNDMLRRIQTEYGLSEANQKIIEGFPAFKWRYRLNYDNDDNIGDAEEKLLQNLFGNIRFDFDQYGYLDELRIDVREDTELPLLNEIDAKELAVQFIKKYSRFQDVEYDSTKVEDDETEESLSISVSPTEGGRIENSTVIRRANRTDYKFNFSAVDEITGDDVFLNVTLAGNIVSDFNAEYQIDDKLTDKPFYPAIIQIVVSVILFITIIIVAYKKFRAYEIGFRSALTFGIIAAIGMLLEMIYEIGPNFQPEVIIGLVLGPLFLGGSLVIGWAVNETVGREVWKEKFIEIDLITNGHFLHSRIGNSLLYGLSIGMFMISVWLLFTYIADQIFSINVLVEGDSDTLFTGNNDTFYLFGKSTYRSIYKAGLLIGFVVSFSRKFINSKNLLLLSTALIFALGLQGNILPFEISLIVEILIGLLVIYSFLQFNMFTILIAVFTNTVLSTGIAYFFIESPDFSSSAIYLIILVLIPVVIALIGILKKDAELDLDSITPAFAKNVTERQRLQGEIQAAKSIQASFLPDTTPEVRGLDISAKCLPALEVGGDYYDFIKHDDKHLSVLIGDVAGKGTKAAFVMSLTKGFFKALAKNLTHPSKVLSDMNELFYEEVGRGSFISIIYGQFDLENKKFTYGRAGHNPILYLKSGKNKAEYLQPQGIAIGMEKGILFSKTIEEQVIEFSSGDIFVLYTDGFPEAMNVRNDQFGEEKFAEILKRCNNKSSNEMMDAFFNETLKFIGRAKQYDDMTMMIVRIL